MKADKTKKDKEIKQVEDLKVKCDEYLNGWKRAQADYQNLIKEHEAKRKEYVSYANANLILEILPILDNFKSAFNQIPEAENNSPWVVGFSYIKKQLEDFLSANGIKQIETVGKKFDHHLHEAIEYIEDSEKPEGEIIEEKKAGYKLEDKVIQVAKVVVSGKNELKNVE